MVRGVGGGSEDIETHRCRYVDMSMSTCIIHELLGRQLARGGSGR